MLARPGPDLAGAALRALPFERLLAGENPTSAHGANRPLAAGSAYEADRPLEPAGEGGERP
jgi:hypothetical protein